MRGSSVVAQPETAARLSSREAHLQPNVPANVGLFLEIDVAAHAFDGLCIQRRSGDFAYGASAQPSVGDAHLLVSYVMSEDEIKRRKCAIGPGNRSPLYN